jgi:Protein of unknown function (DUF2442)
MDQIIALTPLDDYKISIITKSGIEGIFNVKPYIKGEYFEELLDINYFKMVKSIKYGIAWPNEQDFSSDTIIFDILTSQK